MREAAGDSGRLTAKKAKAMTGPYADNAQNFFEKAGRSWASVDTVIASGRRYVQRETEEAAGSDKKLSAVDIRKLPDDLSGDILALQGKAAPKADKPSVTKGLEDAVKAANVEGLNDYGKWFDVQTYPKSKSREDILRTIVGYDDLSDQEVNDWFSSTKGPAAVKGFAEIMRDVGKEELENREVDEPLNGEAAKALFDGVADSVQKSVVPAKLKGVELLEHSIAEDGDTAHSLLIAKKKDDSWLVVSYSDFPF